MALPQLNTTPRYEMIIPSSQKRVRFRPFLVKEQKVLLMAFESKDRRSIIQSILDTIESCVEGVNPQKMTTFDVDYAFTQIRAKSVGETAELTIDCEKCDTANEVTLNLENINVDLKKKNMTVQITDDISIKMKYPDYNMFIKDPNTMDVDSPTQAVIDLIVSCLESIQYEDENILIEDEPREEVEKFIDSLTATQFEKISEFVMDLPKLTHDLKFKCVKCEHENTRTLEGLDDFF